MAAPAGAASADNVLYDQIMGDIEPDLVSESLPTLEVLMADDTPAERMERLQRYKNAFQEFDRQLQDYERNMNLQYAERRKNVLGTLERSEAKSDQAAMASIEESISAAA